MSSLVSKKTFYKPSDETFGDQEFAEIKKQYKQIEAEFNVFSDLEDNGVLVFSGKND